MTGRRAMFWRMVARSVTRRRSRALTAVLAVAIGSATLLGLATIAVDIPRQMSREMRSYGANLLVAPAAGNTAITPETRDRIAAALAGEEVLGAAPYRYAAARINDQPFLAAGADLAGARAVSPYWHVEGRWPARAGEALAGRDVAEVTGAQPGDTLELALADPGAAANPGGTANPGGAANPGAAAGSGEAGAPAAGGAVEFTVSGVLDTGGSEDGLVIMALADLDRLTGGAGQAGIVEYSIAAAPERIEAIAQNLGATVPGVEAAPVRRLTQSDGRVLEMLRLLLALLTGIVLALTMIGVATTMLAVVAERRTEIGLRKALGAHSRAIAREFLAEAAALGALGGIIGAGMGYA
ncbi:MAG: ABC transporter permease, partial [Bifidobacteriaceae bacterium]|nr:ABC transporter permease [Bifidobacteriaceae bacterium]